MKKFEREELERLYLPCECIGNDHGLLVTRYADEDLPDEEPEYFFSIMDGMFTRRNTFFGRLKMAWKTLWGTFYDDFIILNPKDIKKLKEFL